MTTVSDSESPSGIWLPAAWAARDTLHRQLLRTRELEHMLAARRHLAQAPALMPDISDLARRVASYLSMGQQNNVAPEMHTTREPSRAYQQPQFPRHQACGRHHPPGEHHAPPTR